MAIQLQSSDGQVFDTHEEIVKCSGTITALLECDVKKGENHVLKLANVNSAILNKILQWAKFDKDRPAINQNDICEVLVRYEISLWEADFLKMDLVMLFELIEAANYLDIKALLELTTGAVVDMIKGRTPEEIGKFFNIKNDDSAMEH